MPALLWLAGVRHGERELSEYALQQCTEVKTVTVKL